jgi:hypothetical protein
VLGFRSYIPGASWFITRVGPHYRRIEVTGTRSPTALRYSQAQCSW